MDLEHKLSDKISLLRGLHDISEIQDLLDDIKYLLELINIKDKENRYYLDIEVGYKKVSIH